MTKLPWLKFYPGDWRADPALRVCSLAARGLWLEMLGVMHEAAPRCHLLVKGRQVTVKQLAVLTGSSVEECSRLSEELEFAGVFDRRKNGVIVSRRMEKDGHLARKNRENGKKGGNPTLCNNAEKNEPDNPPDKAKKLEARSQIKKETSSQKKETARGSRLPDDWEPNPQTIDWCLNELGWRPFQIESTVQIFRDYWHAEAGQRARKLDWDKTFKNWCRREGKAKPNGSGNKSMATIAMEMAREANDGGDLGGKIGEGDGPVLDLGDEEYRRGRDQSGPDCPL